MEAPHAAALMRNMVDSDRFSEIDLPANLAGLRLSQARSTREELVVAVVHDDEVMVGVNNDPTLESGDQLIILRPSSPDRP
jgi:Trk K+ transport system NAD-binding subunit